MAQKTVHSSSCNGENEEFLEVKFRVVLARWRHSRIKKNFGGRRFQGLFLGNRLKLLDLVDKMDLVDVPSC